MLYVDISYQNWIDYLLINHNSPEGARAFAWTAEECDKIKSISNVLEQKQAHIESENGPIDESFRKVNRWTIPNADPYKWIYEKICKTFLAANRDFWNLDVDLIETVELLQYKFDPSANTQDHYNKHSDFGGKFCGRKLSYSALLSDSTEFKGGDLILYLREDIVLPKDQGQVLIFPSLAFHEVTSVTQGERWSLVTWIKGRPLR